ncbi:IS1096 element passenger TnpR family protein [Thermomonospora echinospora]|uniref:IS1096 element passenger TnpR family protein n=1 Tax=Thermomonospora echinospora TaxID=1992 RepID=UPI0011B0D37D
MTTRRRHGRPDPGLGLVDRDERQTRLDDIARYGDRIRYEYDVSDGWEHELHIAESPFVIVGAGAGRRSMILPARPRPDV